jgi:nitric oxide reductase NorD protein
MWDFLEPEEKIGRYWHRLVGGAASYPRHEQAAVTLGSVRVALGVFFRGLGGTPGLVLAAGSRQVSGHRLGLRQRLGAERERLDSAERNAERVLLPERLDFFPSPDLNRKLYFWLAGFLAVADPAPESRPADPLGADLAFLRRAHRTSQTLCRDYPGLRNIYLALCAALLATRPRRSLPRVEQAVEEVIRALLSHIPPPATSAALYRAVIGTGLDFRELASPRRYRPFLPVPLWGEVSGGQWDGAATGEDPESDPEPQERGQEQGQGRKRARRRDYDQARRDDPLVLNRFEKILSWTEMLNVNRAVDDDDPDSAKKAAEDLDELAIDGRQRRAATRLKLELDLVPAAANTAPCQGESTYPEWDCRSRVYHPAHCRVVASTAPAEGETWTPDTATRQRIRYIRRQFEALRPRREILRRQLDGAELDMDALVRARCDLAAGGSGSDQVYLSARNQARDLAVAILVDVSLSTDSWVANRRVLDVEKEALTALAFGLAACGDDFAIHTFSSRKRQLVQVAAVKGFEERLDSRVLKRIAALRPGHYTRMGAALRHLHRQLAQRPERHRLLLLLSDGKPNDMDHYEGRYGIEDTRKAIQEARRAGLAVFGITIDGKAQDYFPLLFGPGAYAMVHQIDRLPQALPIIYRQLVG